MSAQFPDAVVALCHFCENHGPRIVMTTQALPRILLSHGPFIPFPTPSNHRRPNIPWDKIAEKTAEAPVIIDVLSLMECRKASDEDCPQKDSDDDLVFAELDRRIELVDDEDRCPACSSVGDNVAHVANDYGLRRSFVTTQTALNDDGYMAVKKACFRAFVAEKFSPVESFDWKRRNVHAKGKSLAEGIVDSPEEGLLFFGSDDDHYTAFARSFTLRDAKSRGFQRRYMILVVSSDRHLVNNYQRMLAHELSTTAKLLKVCAQTVYTTEQKLDKKAALRTAKWMPHEIFKSKIHIDTTRSLSVIVDDPNVFFVLHQDFVGVLQRLFAHEIVAVPKYLRYQEDSVIQRMFNSEAAEDLRTIYSRLDPKVFQQLIFHLVAGKQILCRSNDRIARKQFLFALTALLPNDCCNFEPNSRSYRMPGEINLLGLDLDVKVPVNRSDIQLVHLRRRRGVASHKDELFNYNLWVEHCPAQVWLKEAPSIVSRYMTLFKEFAGMDSHSFMQALIYEKMDFMAYVSVIVNTCFTTEQEQNFVKVFDCATVEFEVINFWRRCCRVNKPLDFNLHPIVEESGSIAAQKNATTTTTTNHKPHNNCYNRRQNGAVSCARAVVAGGSKLSGIQECGSPEESALSRSL